MESYELEALEAVTTRPAYPYRTLTVERTGAGAAMGFRIDLDFDHGPASTTVEQEPDGRLAVSVERGGERAVVYLSLQSLEGAVHFQHLQGPAVTARLGLEVRVPLDPAAAATLGSAQRTRVVD